MFCVVAGTSQSNILAVPEFLQYVEVNVPIAMDNIRLARLVVFVEMVLIVEPFAEKWFYV